jgi:hypothetical protein
MNTIENINRKVPENEITPERIERILAGGYKRDGFYYTIKCWSAETPEGGFYAGLGSAEHTINTLILARHFNPWNRYEVTEIREVSVMA